MSAVERGWFVVAEDLFRVEGDWFPRESRTAGEGLTAEQPPAVDGGGSAEDDRLADAAHPEMETKAAIACLNDTGQMLWLFLAII